MEKRKPKSLRKFIRTEKARIRREVLDFKEQENQINDIYKNLAPKSQESKEVVPKKEAEKEPAKKKSKPAKKNKAKKSSK